MVSVFVLLLVTFCLDWAKKCKPVNYNYKVYGGVTEYGHGCKKGCRGWFNVTDGTIDDEGVKDVDGHEEQAECVECKTFTKEWAEKQGYSGDAATEEAKKTCGRETCYWKKGKCVAGSCIVQAAAQKCDEDFGHEFTDGKCKKVKGDKCKAEGLGRDIYKSGPVPSYSDIYASDVLCKDLDSYFKQQSYNCLSVPPYTCSYSGYNPYTADDVKKCKFECEHPEEQYTTTNPSDYSKVYSKYCTKVLGCMPQGVGRCSLLAVWAFIVILVVAILVFVGIIVVVVIILLKLCGSKSTKVDPAADKAASTSKSAPAAAPATQNPPPEVGPYVVIKLGKQESKTKKVESAVWDQSVLLTGLGPEDDDVIFELHDNGDVLLGSADVRIPDYVNAKKRAAVILKNGEDSIGVLEVDIEVQVQEEPEVKITGVFFVDKFVKA